MSKGRWFERCISHQDEDAKQFIEQYFSSDSKNCLFLCGAGFDPRSPKLFTLLHNALRDKMSALLIKEERPDPDNSLIEQADRNLSEIQKLCRTSEVVNVQIFAQDGAVIAGRSAIAFIKQKNLDEFTDIIVDITALSVGVSFPIIRYLFDYINRNNKCINVHVFVISNPKIDSLISSQPNDEVSNVHGFQLQSLSGSSDVATLWMPILHPNKIHQLKKIHTRISPHDTCPILPFPSEDPKLGDVIASHVYSEIQSPWGSYLENDWGLDPKNFVFADERRPLDIYRSILKITDERSPVFSILGGSTTVLTPMGNKAPALGILMAAIEKEFPIVYVESISYSIDLNGLHDMEDWNCSDKIAHVWLCGDAYLTQAESTS